MNESPTRSKLATWVRILIGGLLSAGIAWSLQSVGFIIGIGFYVIPFMLLNSILPRGMNHHLEVQAVLISFLFWFPVGAVITHFIKDNRKAFFILLRLCIIFYFIGYPLLISLWGGG